MDSLLQAQHEAYQRMGRIYENLKKAGPEKITLGRVQSTISHLDKRWAEIELHHASLRDNYWSELKKHEYIVKDFMSVAEETYLTQRGKLVDHEHALQPQPESTKRSLEGQLAPSRRTTLPKIKLPEFSGKYDDWPAFRDLFVSTIDSDEQLPAIEKLHYLRSCVQGEAAAMIQNLPATAVSYKRAWQELSDFYENTRLLVRSYLSKFLSLKKMKGECAADLKHVYHGVINTYDSLANLGRPVSESEDLFVHLIVELLSPRTRDMWDDHVSDSTEPPSFDKLKVFLQRRLQTLDGRLIVKDAKAEAASGKPSSSKKEARSHVTQKKEPGKKSAKSGRCTFCKGEHFLMFCDSFKAKAARERKEHVNENSLCLNCLGKHKTSE